MKKAKQPIFYALSSMASWAVDTGLFYVLELVLSGVLGAAAETVCNVCARVFSSFFNFNVNNRLVFQSKQPYGRALRRYYCLAIPQLAISTLLLIFFVWLLKLEGTNAKTIAKILIDGCLFVASFFIQKFWVFSRKKKKE